MSTARTNSWLPGYLAAGVVWGSSFLFIKVGLEALTPLGVAFFRSVIGGATMLAYALITRQKLPTRMRDIGHLAVMALLLNVIPGYLFALGETQVSSGTAGILNATTPLMTVLVMAVLFRAEKVTASQFVGLLIG
ncbi:MAG: DMT family transporter, partial [Micrococcales bacterium]